ncbi:MAG TPA: sulfotransferase [Gammaproteobacteria bacterium]
MTRLANFVVIGAPKAGTTALYFYLAEHPAILMSPLKETNYFAYGTDAAGQLLYGNSKIHRFRVRTPEAYAALFVNAGNTSAIGEASPIYLECPQAPMRIRDALPGAKIICGLRNPVDRAYSDYLMYLRQFGHRFDPARDLSVSARWAHPDSHWMSVSRYHESLQRYFDAFPRERIHMFLFDDLVRNPAGVMRDIYRFLDVDAEFTPDFDTPYNTGGLPSSPLLEGIFNRRSVRNLVEPLVPKRAMNGLRRLRASNLRKAPELPLELRSRLIDNFRDDITRTSTLIGRNLENWLESAR